MNKSRTIMVAYIAFLIICLVTKPFYNFAMWPVIIVAITFTSSLLAVGDMAFFVASFYEGEIKFINEYHDNTIKEITAILKQVEQKRCKLKGMQESDTIKKCRQTYNEIEQGLNNFKENVRDMHLRGSENAKKVKICRGIGVIATTVGFLFFFCTLTFDALSSSMVEYQDYISLIGFILIMSVHFWNGVNMENRKEEELEVEKGRRMMKEMRYELTTKFPE